MNIWAQQERRNHKVGKFFARTSPTRSLKITMVQGCKITKQPKHN